LINFSLFRSEKQCSRLFVIVRHETLSIDRTSAVLPDGVFSNQKSQFG
jgi:hypothetical protein